MKKILKVNLSSEEILTEMIEEEILRKFVGCWGLALKILYDSLPPGIGPLEPENPLVLMTGPLTGISLVPAGNQTSLATLNADTGFTAGRSHTHGFFGPNLKGAGFDGVIVEGAADKPVYLWISEGSAEIRDATELWGKDTHETERIVKKMVGEPKASVAAIGPAGENLCAGAWIANDENHSFGHSGVGAVMGSKKLKAIAVYGSEEVPIADEERLKEITKKWIHSLMFEYPPTKRRQKGGIARTEYEFLKKRSLVSAKNFTEVSPEEFGKGMSKHKITPKPCFGCPIGCSYDVEIVEGPYKGYKASLSGGGEGMEGAASLCGVYNADAVFYLTDLCDRLGFESSTIGSTIALCIECYEKGLLSKEDTDGMELKWGDPNLVESLLRKAAYREGKLGRLLALGPKRAAEMISEEALKFAVHIKGAGMNMHDWRACWGILFGQIVGGGSGWPAPGADYIPEPDLGIPQLQNPLEWRDKPETARKTGMKKYWDDSTGVCWFATWGVPNALVYTSEAVSAVVGWDFTPEDALLVGERLMNLERAFNIRRGLTPADDIEVSPRLLEPPSAGLAKGRSLAPHLRGMVMEYYRAMGWDEKTGKPLRSTLRRVGLEEIIQDIW